ncbi:MAG: CPBP family intramembrane glutamic endopeptidase [Candidatus Methylumidiphilus sp.]
MNLTRCLVVVVVTELLSLAIARLLLHFYEPMSFQVESIRTVLRIATASIYWWLMRPLILSRTTNTSTFRSPLLIFGLFLFLLVPAVVGHYNLSPPLAIFFAVTSVPVAVKEEFLFRGIVQNLLAEKFGFVKSVLFTSTLFTAWHIGAMEPTVWTFSQIFLASILLGVLYVHSGSILAAIVIHTAYDALFSFTPMLSAPLNENWGFVPLLASVALVSFWALHGAHGLTCLSGWSVPAAFRSTRRQFTSDYKRSDTGPS